MNAALQGYLTAISEGLRDAGTLAQAQEELAAVAALVDGSNELTLAIDDGALPVTARRAVLDELLQGKVLDGVHRLVNRTVTVVPAAEVTTALHALASQEAITSAHADDGVEDPEPVLGRQASRHRVAGYAAAVFESVGVGDLEEIEDQLFRFARTVEANRALRGALGDRDLPVPLRQRVVGELLRDRVLPATLRLVDYVIKGGRARDVVGTLDSLVVEAARARGWRVARVNAADSVGAAQQADLSDALARLTGGPVELQVTIDPSLLGGVVVQVGDLLVDGSTRHRLDLLKEHLLTHEAAYQAPEREAT